jgi:hypothetical protein
MRPNLSWLRQGGGPLHKEEEAAAAVEPTDVPSTAHVMAVEETSVVVVIFASVFFKSNNVCT